ncbi:MAG: ParA family protein [Blastocatellia bacterium]|nr:ParA family protein [Blastocatellia bacterium]
MSVIAIANQKGGVGKTTTAVNLAAGLALAGYTVCLIDCDPQGNATTYVNDQLEIDYTLTDVVCTPSDMKKGFLPVMDAIYQTSMENLHVLPSKITLSRFERESVIAVDRLAKTITTVGREYDFTVCDTPPSLGPLFTGALKAASHLIIPLTPAHLSLEGISTLLDTIEEIRQIRPEGMPLLEILGVLLTRYDPRTNISKEVFATISAHPQLGPRLLNARITVNTRLDEAPGDHVPIYLSPWKGESLDRAMEQFNELTHEILKQLKVPAPGSRGKLKEVK